jgi:ribosome-associated toxin RatA of RatAB toxin-antitoxin module
MKIVERAALVQYSASAMYRLVEDIESYPTFLPWCSRTEVLKRDERSTVATIHISYSGLRQAFTTENFKEPGEAIVMNLVQGPFKHLHGEWRFKPLGEGACKVDFRLNYELSNSLFETLLGPMFHHIADTLVDAFVKRAEALSGGAGRP